MCGLDSVRARVPDAGLNPILISGWGAREGCRERAGPSGWSRGGGSPAVAARVAALEGGGTRVGVGLDCAAIDGKN